MGSPTRDTTLEDVRVFAYTPCLTRPEEIFTVFVDEKKPTCLKSHAFFVDKDVSLGYDEILMMKDIRVWNKSLEPSWKWKMQIQASRNFLDSLEEVQKTLKKVRTVFGVWGEEQRAFFAKFLDNVVDVASLIMENVRDFYQKPRDGFVDPYEECVLIPRASLAGLFLYVLSNHAFVKKEHEKEYSIEEFEDFIRVEAWKSFLTVGYVSYQIHTHYTLSDNYSSAGGIVS